MVPWSSGLHCFCGKLAITCIVVPCTSYVCYPLAAFKVFLFSFGFQQFDYDIPRCGFLCTYGFVELLGFVSCFVSSDLGNFQPLFLKMSFFSLCPSPPFTPGSPVIQMIDVWICSYGIKNMFIVFPLFLCSSDWLIFVSHPVDFSL